MTMLAAAIGALLLIASSTTTARGDGGAVQVRETHGTTDVTVFTSPMPLRVGMIDVSVLVQDHASGATVTDAEIEVVLHPVDYPRRTLHGIAGTERVVNKLLRAAEFELFEPGRMQFEVIVRRSQHAESRVRFQAEVAPSLPRWVRYWPWFTWPAVVVALFALRRTSSSRRDVK